jgi:hypothetical protein
VQLLFSAIEVEGSSEKGCCKKTFKFSGAGFEEAQSADILVQLIERPSFEAFVHKDSCDAWKASDDVIRSSAEAHVVDIGAREGWVAPVYLTNSV